MDYRKIASLLLLAATTLNAHTISDKMKAAQLHEETNRADLMNLLDRVNLETREIKKELKEKYEQALILSQESASEEAFRSLLSEINALRQKLDLLEEDWREESIHAATGNGDAYAFWDQQETTLSQLIMEYGATDYLYVIPQELLSIKLQVHSAIPIPRESWSEMMEIILSQNGIGVKKLNPYARQLYLLKHDLSAVSNIASKKEDLKLVPTSARVFYVLSPVPDQVKNIYSFLERFSDAKQTFIYQVGDKIAIVSQKEEIEKLLALYESVWQESAEKISKVVPLSKTSAKEMEKILKAYFTSSTDTNKPRPPFLRAESEVLLIHPLAEANSLMLIGEKNIVKKAEEIVNDTEAQLIEPTSKLVYLYHCKHSDPVDLAKTLERVYRSLATNSSELKISGEEVSMPPPTMEIPVPSTEKEKGFTIPTTNVKPGVSSTASEKKFQSENFIPDAKTGTILMVVEKPILEKLKHLLTKLDVPKKMVKIEVLLFEKKYNKDSGFGLNLLRLGSDKCKAIYNALNAPTGRGVFEFLLGNNREGHAPAYDIAYNFLMSQEDVALNAAPSVTTVNQTPATISIVEEISIDTGAVPVDTGKGSILQKSYSRAQYGITLILTPTIHLSGLEESLDEASKNQITLQTDISFDSPRPGGGDKPLVDRRYIKNEVRVTDGETIIIGGLRKKATAELDDKIPFLGEIPGLGKLFGSTKLSNHNTEMFFFITPRIIEDSQKEMDAVRLQELKKRPGDIPEFLKVLDEARKKEKKKLFEQSLELFGKNG